MAVKCPSCGFDSAEDALWCDFCKHPFQKKKPAAPPPKPAASAPAAAAVNPGPKLGPEVLKLSPQELAQFDDGEKVPAVPPWARAAAWGFLAFCSLMLLILLLMAMHRMNEAPPPVQAPPPQAFKPR